MINDKNSWFFASGLTILKEYAQDIDAIKFAINYIISPAIIITEMFYEELKKYKGKFDFATTETQNFVIFYSITKFLVTVNERNVIFTLLVPLITKSMSNVYQLISLPNFNKMVLDVWILINLKTVKYVVEKS